MTSLFASLIGFIGSLVPELLKMLRERHDRRHELAILDRQIALQEAGQQQRLEEIEVSAATTERETLYNTYTTNISWVDALNGTVRPVLAYAFFLLYAIVKIIRFSPDMPWLFWQEEDQALFAGIISFYFGQRAMRK